MPPTVNDKSPLSPDGRGDDFFFLFRPNTFGRSVGRPGGYFVSSRDKTYIREKYKTLYNMIIYLLRVKMMSYFLGAAAGCK